MKNTNLENEIKNKLIKLKEIEKIKIENYQKIHVARIEEMQILKDLENLNQSSI